MANTISSNYAEEITARLRAFGRGSRQAHRPSSQDDFGVYTSDLRTVVRDFKKLLKDTDGKIVLDLGKGLLSKNVTECRQVAYEIISAHPGAMQLLSRKSVEELGKGIDNWCCVDNFCSCIAGRAWREGLITDSAIKDWSVSANLWWRRAAVVSTVALNTKSRGGTGDTKRTLEICLALLEDGEPMVQKAISWALRELIPWDREAVEAFLASKDKQLSNLVRREVEKKLRTGKKN